MPLPPRAHACRRSRVLRSLAFLALISVALPAQADIKKVLWVVPKAMQRTATNMVTFQNREAAVLQWLTLAAAFADAETTRRSINRGSIEHNPFLGRRPSAARTYTTLLTVGFGYATMTQVIQDRVEKPRPFTLGLTAMVIGAHAYVSYHNTTICPGNTTCNAQPIQ